MHYKCTVIAHYDTTQPTTLRGRKSATPNALDILGAHADSVLRQIYVATESGLKTVRRRMGPPDSAAFNQLLDATERVMRNEGYAAASSRKIALEAGLKQQLVYYYFETMDDLLLAAFKRRTALALARIDEEVTADNPAQTIWKTWINTVDAKLVFEFMALANHHKGVREEVNRFVSVAREKHATAIGRQLDRRGPSAAPLTSDALAFLLYSTALILGREAAMGNTSGHADVMKLVEWALEQVG